jgi:hypothetical protein
VQKELTRPRTVLLKGFISQQQKGTGCDAGDFFYEKICLDFGVHYSCLR